MKPTGSEEGKRTCRGKALHALERATRREVYAPKGLKGELDLIVVTKGGRRAINA
jgi:hypothetical protein